MTKMLLPPLFASPCGLSLCTFAMFSMPQMLAGRTVRCTTQSSALPLSRETVSDAMPWMFLLLYRAHARQLATPTALIRPHSDLSLTKNWAAFPLKPGYRVTLVKSIPASTIWSLGAPKYRRGSLAYFSPHPEYMTTTAPSGMRPYSDSQASRSDTSTVARGSSLSRDHEEKNDASNQQKLYCTYVVS